MVTGCLARYFFLYIWLLILKHEHRTVWKRVFTLQYPVYSSTVIATCIKRNWRGVVYSPVPGEWNFMLVLDPLNIVLFPDCPCGLKPYLIQLKACGGDCVLFWWSGWTTYLLLDIAAAAVHDVVPVIFLWHNVSCSPIIKWNC